MHKGGKKVHAEISVYVCVCVGACVPQQDNECVQV